jgi:hypothetical protein
MCWRIGRAFFFKWTVNFKYLPEDIFLSPVLHKALLVATIIGIIIILDRSERKRGRHGLSSSCKHQVSVSAVTKDATAQAQVVAVEPGNDLQRGFNGVMVSSDDIISTMFLSNFVGIVFSR